MSAEAFPAMCERGNLSIAHTGMADMFAGLYHLQAAGAHQLALSTQYMWAQYLAAPSMNAASAQRLVAESVDPRIPVNPSVKPGTP